MHPEICNLDPRIPVQREHLPNIRRLAAETVESEDGTITITGRDPETWEIVEIISFDLAKERI